MCNDWTVKYENKMIFRRSRRRYGDNINHGHETLWFEAFDRWYMKVEGLKFKIKNGGFIDYVIGSDIIGIVESLPEGEGGIL
jgi:hypothetical protein